MGLRRRVRIAAGGRVRLAFATGVAPTRAAALALAEKYDDPSAAARAFALASSQTGMRLRHLGISTDEARLYERLASRVLWTDDTLRAPVALLAANTLGQPGLWALGVSGDLPILVVRAVRAEDVSLVLQVLRAQEYWRLKGLSADVVILNDHPESYRDEMHEQLQGLLEKGPWAAWKHRPGGVYLLRGTGAPDAERTAASAVLDGAVGDLTSQLGLPYPEPNWPDPLPAHTGGTAAITENPVRNVEPPPMTHSNQRPLA